MPQPWFRFVRDWQFNRMASKRYSTMIARFIMDELQENSILLSLCNIRRLDDLTEG